MDFIFMLTRDDRTVPDCLDLLDEVADLGLRHIGFKDIGVSPETVIVSATAPTFSSALIVATNVPVSSMPSRLNALKPVSENVTE